VPHDVTGSRDTLQSCITRPASIFDFLTSRVLSNTCQSAPTRARERRGRGCSCRRRNTCCN